MQNSNEADEKEEVGVEGTPTEDTELDTSDLTTEELEELERS